ncbi:hypothetical protein VTK73DRAFT_5672 [Phialemonium thermophilum]|uniref:Carotenoid oxygenase n=1 Tax=Phialemonium thermophilum TaxID=223376 RepID=A0ABR3WMP7_9PEZI
MAHIYDLAPEVAPYVDGRLSGDRVKFPDTDVFRSMNKPSRIEGDVFDLEFSGTIPKDINGTFYRIQPDHRFPPLFEDDIHFNGDGSVTAIRIRDGHADFKQRYVHTERYKLETAARRSLFGRYRNPYTDNESVRGVIRTASNTNITFWRGMLLATKEDGPPYAMDPVTLETIGRYDFEGQILAPTFTAHPKFDPDTGEMLCFAYEAGGNGSDCSVDVAVWTIDADGVKTEEAWYKAPFAGMIHDCGVSKNYMVLPLTPIKMDLDRMKRGGNKFAWDPQEDQWYGLVPRRGGKPEDIRWFRADNGMCSGRTESCVRLLAFFLIFPFFSFPSFIYNVIYIYIYIYLKELHLTYFSQASTAILPAATRTRTATWWSTSPSPTATSSSGSRRTARTRARSRSATSSAARRAAGRWTPRPRRTRASRRRWCGRPTASSRASTTAS